MVRGREDVHGDIASRYNSLEDWDKILPQLDRGG